VIAGAELEFLFVKSALTERRYNEGYTFIQRLAGQFSP
jgi:hypothetical protein